MKCIETRIGELCFTHDFIDGYPTDETVDKLYDEINFQRACQVYLWAIPIVSFAQWQYAHEQTLGAENGDIVYYPTYASKLGLLTANATTPYAASFIDLADTGPVVVEMPPAEVRGAMHDMWQIAIAPLTEPGKYVFYAPGTPRPTVPEDIAEERIFEATTNSVFFGIRLMSDSRIQRRKDLSAIKIYPLGATSEETRVIRLTNEEWQGWQPRGIEYFKRLAHILKREPVDERDRFFHAMLKPLGITHEKGFRANEAQREILTEAALVGEAMAKANDFSKRLEAAHYVENSHWELATVSPASQRWDDYEALDGRAAWFYEAVTNDDAMQSTVPCTDQIYLGAYKDADGDWLDGGTTYRLRLPLDVPFFDGENIDACGCGTEGAKPGFWSVTVYDVSTRCLIENDALIGDCSSKTEGLQVNTEENLVDIYFGPNQPKDLKTNWIPTVPEQAWFAYFRLYSPTEAYFARTWVLPDIEKLV